MGTKDSAKTREARKKRNELAAEAKAAEKGMTDEQRKEKKRKDRFLYNLEITKRRRQERKALVTEAEEEARPIRDAQYDLGRLLSQGNVVETMLKNLPVLRAASARDNQMN